MASNDGVYGKALHEMLTDGVGKSMESETECKGLLVQDAYTPDFTAHTRRDDVTNEASGAGYTTGGNVITATEVTFSGGVLVWDFDNPSWASSTITARAHLPYFDFGVASSDLLILSSPFASDHSTTSATFTVQIDATGALRITHVP